MDLKFYLSLFLRRLPYFLILVALGSALGLTLARMLPPSYEAQARLLVESPQIPGDLAASTVRIGAREQMQIIQQRILTRANLLEMANRLQVYAGPTRTGALSADDMVADLRNRIRISVTGGSNPRGPSQAVMATVGFKAPTSALAANVTNEIVTMILQEDVTMRTGVASQTLDFFEQEVARLDQELARRGQEILEFKQANQSALPDSLDFRRNRLGALQERLSQQEREESALKDRRERLVTLFETTGRVDTSGVQQTPEERQLASLQDQRSGLLAVLSPNNPRITVLEAQIAALEAQIAARSGASDGADAALTAYQVQLADIDGQLEFIADRKAEIETQMADLERTIDATPANAIVLGTMERDYDNVRTQYNQAVARRATAETGDLIETLSKGGRISVIEQAIAPREPSSPNRPLIAAAGVGGGIAAGLGLVILLEVMNAAIRRPVDLSGRLGITPFATLPYMRTRREAAMRRMVILGAMTVVLAGIPAGIWAVHTYYMPLDMLLDKVMRQIGIALLSAPGAAAIA